MTNSRLIQCHARVLPSPDQWEKQAGSLEALRVTRPVAVVLAGNNAWRLEHGLGLKPANQADLNAGTRHHERKVAERVAGGSAGIGRLLVVVVLVILLVLWLVWR